MVVVVVIVLVHLLVNVDHLNGGLIVQVVELQLLLLLGLLQGFREIGEALEVLQLQFGVLAEDDLLDQHIGRVLVLGRLLLQLVVVVNVLVKGICDVAHYARPGCTAPANTRPTDAAPAHAVHHTTPR